MTARHGRHAGLYPIVGMDVSAANKYDPPNTSTYDEPKFLSHLNFLIFRLSLSASRDMDAEYHIGLVAKYGITAWAVYLAPKIGKSNWKQQADNPVFFLEDFRRRYGTPLVPPMGVFMDVERLSLDTAVDHTKLSVTNWLIKYADRLAENFGEEALGVYTGLVWNELTYKTDRFKNMPLFHAQYNDWVTEPTTLARDWEEHRNLQKKWKLWQWAAGGYKIDGAPSGKHVGVHSAYIDLDRANVASSAEFKQQWGCEPWRYEGDVPPDPPPPPPPPDPPDPDLPVIGKVNTGGTGQTLWTHTEPNSLVSTRKGALPEGLEVTIEDTDNSGDWYLLKKSGNWASAKYIDIII